MTADATGAAYITAVALCLAYAGLAALCLAMERHHAAVFGEPLPILRQRILRLAGSLLLAFSLWICWRQEGGAYGTAQWFGMLVATGLVLVWVLAYRPRLAMALGVLCVAGAAVLALA